MPDSVMVARDTLTVVILVRVQVGQLNESYGGASRLVTAAVNPTAESKYTVGRLHGEKRS